MSTNHREVDIANLGTQFKPKWRLLVDGIEFGQAAQPEDLVPLLLELEDDPSKLQAVRDFRLGIY